jgi:hypothetical protein
MANHLDLIVMETVNGMLKIVQSNYQLGSKKEKRN